MLVDNRKYIRARGYLTIGIQYLHLVESVSQKIIESGNPLIVIKDKRVTVDEYLEGVRWSDHNLIIPVLFNFYHGIELLLKSFIILGGENITNKHKLSELVLLFDKMFPRSSFGKFASKYVAMKSLPKLLKEFCETSGITVDDYYQSLKYPESTKGAKFNHVPLKYKSAKGVVFFEELVGDIRKARADAVSLGRQFEIRA